jgi:hypothetical protein
MADEDNRIRLDIPLGFENAGTTGQNHDTYPAPGDARYDFMRTYLIGLLANQASDDEPLEKRTGTLWFQKLAGLLAIFNGAEFEQLSKHIGVEIESGTDEVVIKTIQDVLSEVLVQLQYVAPRVIWSGRFTGSEGTDQIIIPEKFQGYAAIPNIHPLVYVDGKLLDPRLVSICGSSPYYIGANDSVDFKRGQSYTVILEHVTEICPDDIQGLA